MRVVPGVGTFHVEQKRFDWLKLLSFGRTSTLAIRFESRKHGEFKIKTKYLQNYNLLESTFLTASIVILLCGIMFKSAQFPPEYV